MSDISSMTIGETVYSFKDAIARTGEELPVMTLSQYNQLTSEQKNDGTVRFITDGIIDPISAATSASVGDLLRVAAVDAYGTPTAFSFLSGIATSFSISLASSLWTSNAQTVSNINFLSTGYGYIAAPVGSSFSDYAAAVIYADEVTTDGNMTFHCSENPASDLTVNIMRVVVT